jgi:hypothetical protein
VLVSVSQAARKQQQRGACCVRACVLTCALQAGLLRCFRLRLYAWLEPRLPPQSAVHSSPHLHHRLSLPTNLATARLHHPPHPVMKTARPTLPASNTLFDTLAEQRTSGTSCSSLASPAVPDQVPLASRSL